MRKKKRKERGEKSRNKRKMEKETKEKKEKKDKERRKDIWREKEKENRVKLRNEEIHCIHVKNKYERELIPSLYKRCN